ncbi:MAG TPA: DUF3800 domain-containing protein [Stellaceae bacterium]|nr:DUF3800 domain-containing protein [Stellaceae bacterium]
MHILYVDDSGDAENPKERHFVLGGVAVFERGLYHVIKAADNCVAGFGLGDADDIELHGSPMYAGRDFWRSVRDRATREKLITSALNTLHGHRSIRLFAVVVDKAAASPRDPVSLAFEEMCNRFNLFLARLNDRSSPEQGQRGLIVMDEMKHEKPLQMLARKYRAHGGSWGHFRNLAEVPLFADSKASRVIQLADLVAWATWRKYEFGDGRFFDPITKIFDAQGGVIHGLVHRHFGAINCYCPSCLTRANRDAREATAK